MREKDITLEMTIEAVNVLIGMGSVSPVNEINKTPDKEKLENLNRKIISLSTSGRDIRFLASPVTGGAIFVSNITQSFLNSYLLGKVSVDNLVEDALDILVGANKRLQKDGKTIENIEETRTELKLQAKDFLLTIVPFLEGHNLLQSKKTK